MSVLPDCVLARVMRVEKVEPIEGARSIELYTVGGWTVVDKIVLYKEGDLVIHCMINSIFPDGNRIKTKKILGVLSQGIILPVGERDVKEDDDLTQDLNLRKYVPPLEEHLYKEDEDKAPFPPFVPKTDEVRIQSCKKLLYKLDGVSCVITEKRDGTSTTYIFCRDRFMVAGRNHVHLRPNSTSRVYFEMANGLEEKMRRMGRNLAIQGEITGPRIGKNLHKLSRLKFHVFNVYSIDESRYLPWRDVIEICEELGLQHVEVLHWGVIIKPTVEYFIGLADTQLEGIVVKTDEGPRVSFKCISNLYLQRYE